MNICYAKVAMPTAHENYLPQFADKIQELKAQGVETDDEVVKDLLRRGL